MIQIDNLASHPEWITVLAHWHFVEWHRLYPGWTIKAAEEELARHVEPMRIPTTLVALQGVEPVGSVSLVERDLPGWDYLSPWLASLYVRPDLRRRGIGKLLVSQAEAKAHKIGCEMLYLFTPGQQEFYRTLDWHIVAETVTAEAAVSVMSKWL